MKTNRDERRATVPRVGYWWREAATASGMTETQVFRAMQSGELPSLKVGRRRIVRADALDAFLRRREAAGLPGRHGGETEATS